MKRWLINDDEVQASRCLHSHPAPAERVMARRHRRLSRCVRVNWSDKSERFLSMKTMTATQLTLIAGICFSGWHATGAQAPPPRTRAEVDAVLSKAPRPDPSAPVRPLHVLLVAGPKDHGPGEHDYPAWQRQWATLLPKAPGVRVSTAFPWPTPEQWDGVDVAVFYLKTRWDAQQLAEIQRHQARGRGVVTIHWAIGCDQDWDNHARHFGLSYKAASYRHGPTELRLPNPAHPLLLGLPRSMHFVDEPYWPFIGDPSRVTVLATSDERIHQGDDRLQNPGDGTLATVPVFWTYEPPGTNARVFVSIFGHYAWTFDDPLFRLLLLRGISWAAKENSYRLDPLALEGVTLASAPAPSATTSNTIITPPVIESADDTAYANRPYWYKPGHPLNPAEAPTIKTLPGFKAERIFALPREEGTLTALATDPQGRLLAAAQIHPGIYRITPPQIGDSNAATKVEKLGGAAARIGWSHGLLYAFDSLYVTVAENNNSAVKGLHRLRDTDGDDQFDHSELLFELKGGGEHGPHNLVAGPDGKSLYLMGGNGTPLPPNVNLRRPAATEGIDRPMPPGFESAKYSVQGWVLRFDPTGSERELITGGLRNSFDLAFNHAGDLFTFDSDGEWDLGTPWYRPTRICHLVGGGEFGWREGSAMWPEYLEDSTAPVVNIGPASPTGIVFGYGTKFPAKYQRALYACDWTFATIHAIHLRPHAASYRADVEEFVGGTGLPLTDIVAGKEGALYFTVGGRQLGSAIYRVRYVGDESNAPAGAEEFAPQARALHSLRSELEHWHGRDDPATAATVWPHLGHSDRAVRFAARVALEAQPAARWREQALAETHLETSLTALLALARQGTPEDQPRVLQRLSKLDWTPLSTGQKLRVLRAHELAFARGMELIAEQRTITAQRLRPHFPDADDSVNRELSRLLCSLGDTTMIEPLLARMEADTGDRPLLGSGYFVRNPKYGAAVSDMLQSAPRIERMHGALTLLWLSDGWSQKQHRRYFASIADALANSRGGHQYREFWSRIRDSALKRLPESQRQEFEAIAARAPALAEGLPVPKGPGQEWTLPKALALVGGGLNDRDPQRGRTMFAAAGCALCHQAGGEGGAIGPDLSTLGQRFTVHDILEATIHPSKAIPDQYQVMTLELTDGKTLSGRIVSRDERFTRIATDLMRPSDSVAVANASITKTIAQPISTMPAGLLNPLNEDELLDLLAYLKAQAL
jgi:putative heme-binding domain-containing protein